MGGLSNYPPGVTGNEPEIIGWPPCTACGHDAEDHGEGDYPHEEGCTVEGCSCTEYDQYGEGR